MASTEATSEDPLEPVNEYWREKTHERDLREHKWPRSVDEITLRWLCAYLESDVLDFSTNAVGTSEISVNVRLKIQHANKLLQQTKASSAMVEFSSPCDAVRCMWQKAYNSLVTFRVEFSNLNPTSAQTLSANFNPDRPFHYCLISEDVVQDTQFIEFSDWAKEGVNLRFVHLMLKSAADSHSAWFQNPGVTKLLRCRGGLRPSSQFVPGFTDILQAFFEPSALVTALSSTTDGRFAQQSIRQVYKSMAEESGRQLPVPSLYGHQGQAIIERCLDIYGTRPLTLCNGELLPGTSYLNVRTNKFVWYSWRLVCAAPAGMDLAVPILTALQPSTKDQIRGLVTNYYSELIAGGVDDALYTVEQCWEDFLIGCLLFCCTYPATEVERILNRPQSTDSYLPHVHQRLLRNATTLDLEAFARSLVQSEAVVVSAPPVDRSTATKQAAPVPKPARVTPARDKVELKVPFT